MKCKLLISAIDCGKVVKFRHTIETPDFQPETRTFLGHTWVETAAEQQCDWLRDNWYVVVAACEERDFHPILNAVVLDEQPKTPKKEQVANLLKEVAGDLNPEHLAIVIGTLNDMWPTVKKMSPEQILLIAFQSVNATFKVSTAILKDLNEVISGKKRLAE